MFCKSCCGVSCKATVALEVVECFLRLIWDFLLQSSREDVGSIEGLKEDGFAVKECVQESQVKVTSGEAVCFEEEFCSIWEGVACERTVVAEEVVWEADIIEKVSEGVAEKVSTDKEVVKETLAFEKVSEGIAEKVYSGEEVVREMLAAKKVFEGITVKEGVSIQDQVGFKGKVEENFL